MVLVLFGEVVVVVNTVVTAGVVEAGEVVVDVVVAGVIVAGIIAAGVAGVVAPPRKAPGGIRAGTRT